MDALWVTLAALVTALATGLGALPFAFVGEMSRRWLGASNAIAAGFMLSASGALLIEGAIRGVLAHCGRRGGGRASSSGARTGRSAVTSCTWARCAEPTR